MCKQVSTNAISMRTSKVGGPLTGTNPTQGFITPGDLQKYQAQLKSLAEALDPTLENCVAMQQPGLVDSWKGTLKSIETWAALKWGSDFLDLGTQWLAGQDLEQSLVEWTDFASGNCGFKPAPPPAPPLTSATQGLTDAAKWAAIGLGALAIIVLTKSIL